ncbi:MAG: hypothetical protein JO111_10425 [Caulobacteraceae bacterium]|nr:hypothetical protein [Caulobacteraceae bacterium]
MSALNDRFRKRIAKKARRGHRGWPTATVAFYGPDLDRASKAVVTIFRFKGDQDAEMRTWLSETSDVRTDPAITREMIEFIELHGSQSVGMIDGIIGCPHQEGIDYEGEWCPECAFWKGRDRFTGELVSEDG